MNGIKKEFDFKWQWNDTKTVWRDYNAAIQSSLTDAVEKDEEKVKENIYCLKKSVFIIFC